MSVLENLHPTRRRLLIENRSLAIDQQGREIY